MDKPLVVGVDGSDPSLRALDWAVDEAAARGVPLRVVHASRWEWYEGHEPSFGINRTSVQVLSDHIAATAVERALRRAASLKVTSDVLSEDPAAALVRLSSEAGAIVVGNRGRGEIAELLLGSVGLSVAAHATSPVIVVRGGERNLSRGFGSVAVGLDEPREADAAMEFALREAETHKAAVSVIHAWRCPAREAPDFPARTSDEHQRRGEEQVEEALRGTAASHPGIGIRRQIVEGHARDALLDAARTADLLVVGARRRKGHLGLQLGPVNHAVLHHAACPVAVVPHG
ncbi:MULTISPECIES: universal stress protein [unclassified Streptomyces]|uniref:universal stress protein n=1 Tax=Streptomyces sp. SYP-A7185 TaxID=3040076 RepID=UPI0038F78B05